MFLVLASYQMANAKEAQGEVGHFEAMISILTPAYIDTIEKLEWLNEMLKSVQDQFFTDWELILIDDASPLTITIETPDERIRQVRTVRRSGPALARNTAVALARFEALLPIDADDLLPGPDTLALLHSAWQHDHNLVIYGDLQRLEKVEGVWRKGKVFDLPEYTFQRAMDFNGIMPVTAMHSKECHQRAGGWKPELEAGLEDVEYWLAAGKAGFCGKRVSEVALLYRRHDESRSNHLRLINKRETEMRNLIREMHADVFEGRFPMGCCGGGRSYTPPENLIASSVSAPTTLDQLSADLKVWVEYSGQREGSFGMVGRFSNIPYTVNGPGHKLEIHVSDLPMFQRSGRGLDFKIGVAPPNGHVVTPTPQKGENPAFIAPEVQMAQILQLDEIGNRE